MKQGQTSLVIMHTEPYMHQVLLLSKPILSSLSIIHSTGLIFIGDNASFHLMLLLSSWAPFWSTADHLVIYPHDPGLPSEHPWSKHCPQLSSCHPGEETQNLFGFRTMDLTIFQHCSHRLELQWAATQTPDGPDFFYHSSSVVPNLGSPDVLGLKLPKAFPISCAG